MQTNLKTKPVWIQLLIFLAISFSVFIVLLFIGTMILSSITGINPLTLRDVNSWDANNPQMISFLRGLFLVQFITLWVIPTILFAFLSDPHPMDYLGIKSPSKNSYWLLAILLLIFSIPLVDYSGLINQKMNFGPSLQQWIKTKDDEGAKQIQFMLSHHTPKELIMNLIYIALFAGIGEELFFRGILQRMFIRIFRNPWAGIVFTALIFSAFHMQFLGFLPRFLLGILLGAIYWYSGSLLLAMFAHFFYDGLMIVLAYNSPKMMQSDATIMNPASIVIYAIISAALTISVLYLMRKMSSTSYVQIYKNDIPQVDKFTF